MPAADSRISRGSGEPADGASLAEHGNGRPLAETLHKGMPDLLMLEASNELALEDEPEFHIVIEGHHPANSSENRHQGPGRRSQIQAAFNLIPLRDDGIAEAASRAEIHLDHIARFEPAWRPSCCTHAARRPGRDHVPGQQLGK